MYRCTIVSVGDELLDGRVSDTNSDYITAKLSSLGLEVSLKVEVGDDRVRLRDTIAWVMEISDLIIVTGGLGPTSDDLTREATADALSLPLKRDEDLERAIEAIFLRMGREMARSNLKQADLLEGAIPLTARLGTAPGQWIERNGQYLILLPGVPREMRNMMSADVLPRLSERLQEKKRRTSISLHVAAKAESEVGELVESKLAGMEEVKVSYRARPGQIEIRLSSWGDPDRVAEAASAIKETVADWLVAEGDATLEGNLGRELRSRGLSLAVAESCTGGMVGERITRVPGSSDYFKGGVVAYTYQAKEDLLGVSGDVLREKGAVNEEVAEAMALGVRDRLKAGIGVAITGVAGPGSAGEREPVGTVAFGIATREGTSSWKYRLPGDRETVREAAATITLALTYFYLRGGVKIGAR